MKIVLRKSEDMDDWYTIERAEHENRTEFRQFAPNSYSLWYSGRISDADVEGTAEEMRTIARAIIARDFVAFSRCAVRTDDHGCYFSSPRNSTCDGFVPMADADAFAEEVLEKLKEKE